MFDPTVHQALEESTDTFEAIAGPDAEKTEGAEKLWTVWKDLGYWLQEMGVTPRAMCDTSNAIASVRVDVHERTGTTH